MPTAQVYDMQGAVVREESLDDYVFGAHVNTAVLHQVVTAQLTNRRQGTASTKTRAEVSGGNKKPYRQKGTGRARQGSTRAPQFRGGGSVFGPRPHPYERAIPRKMKRLAIRSALSDKAANGRILLVETIALEEARTRVMEQFLSTLPLERRLLILLPERDETVIRATSNIHRAKVGNVASINVVELLKHDHLLMPLATVGKIVEAFGEEADDRLQLKRHPRVVFRRRARRAAEAGAASSTAPTTRSAAGAAQGAQATPLAGRTEGRTEGRPAGGPAGRQPGRTPGKGE